MNCDSLKSDENYDLWNFLGQFFEIFEFEFETKIF